MARYLNPQKISLLVLTSLYCESKIPHGATIPILSFLTSQIVSPSPAEAGGSSKAASDGVLSIHDFEKVLAPYESERTGDTLFDDFLNGLWTIDSLDALHGFFDCLSDLLAQPRRAAQDAESQPEDRKTMLSRTSPLGIYVRRAQLEFARLQFHDASKLWLAFVNYKLPTAEWWQRRSGHMVEADFDANLSELGTGRADDLFHVAYGQLDDLGGEDGLASTDEVERTLAFQIDRLQKYGNRVPDDMRDRLRKMLGPTSSVPSLAHFVRFFDAWRAGDYTSSFDNLHRYFDYTMQTRDKTYYQYALLHMAILQADFGCFSEAIAAMNETIATARENQDMSCLNFSLSWLNHLAKAHPQQIKASGYGGMLGSERDGLAFLKSKARETKMWSLLSSTLLSESKMLLANGSGVPRAFELIYQSAHLNVVHNIRSNVGSQMLMQASLYGRLGVTHLSNVVCDILRTCYGSVCPIEDMLRSICHSAYISCQGGRYGEAFKMLDSVDPADHRTLKFHQYISNYSALLKAKRALRRSDTVTSTHLLNSLRSFRPTDPEILHQLSLLEIESHIRLGAFSAASSLIDALLASLRSDDSAADVYQRVHLLVLKAQLFATAGVPEKGFSLALRAAAAAHRARLWPALWEALAVVQGVLVEMEEFGAARKLGDAVVPQALEGGDEALCARLYLNLADACVGLAGEEGGAAAAGSRRVGASGNEGEGDVAAGPRFEQRRVEEAEGFLERARECFAKIEDVRGECETLAKRALLEKLKAAVDGGSIASGGGSHHKDDPATDSAISYIQTYKSALEAESGGVGETVG